MDDSTGLVFGRVDIPQFLDTETIDLRLAVCSQFKLPFQYLGEMAMGALGEECIFGMQFEAGLVIRLVTAIAGDAHISRGDAFYRSIVIIKNLRSSEAGENLDAHILGPFGKPAAQIAK